MSERNEVTKMKMRMDSMTAKMRIHWILPMNVTLPLGLPVTPQCPPLQVSARFHLPLQHSHTSHPLKKKRHHQQPPQTSLMRSPSSYQKFLLIPEKTKPLLSRKLCINPSLRHNITDLKEKRRCNLPPSQCFHSFLLIERVRKVVWRGKRSFLSFFAQLYSYSSVAFVIFWILSLRPTLSGF